ncbi:SARP family transcriptional regulator [Streptomyces tateyamensis]|uniref:SARP family transcriptional regulator n=1 Tax=Streptomyces tateyamensis TaxID=565073 RepID=A0A2V4MWV5_9ACTN|nr:BTAD domain-containing putative transcriptional regulator [Streptomyces tateyamensis]PYC66072.1 SARP family transcriptional regulator [Streptomyces tateyamensis]
MQYRVLGSLEVRLGERQVEVERPRRRALLAFLLLNANQYVTTERLVDALWGEAPPASARGQLHTALSELRKLLGTGETGPLGFRNGAYLLSVDEGCLDATAFRHSVGEARRLRESGAAVEAARVIRAGLGLWRGGALTGIDAPFAEPVRTLLEEERSTAYELLADIELDLGRHQQLVPELTELIERYPAREGLAERLMLALHRGGRQTDALAVARRVRKVLAEDFGLDPGRSLVELEGAILRDEPGLRPDAAPGAATAGTAAPAVPAGAGASWSERWGDAPRPAQLPSSARGFVGRTAETARLDDVLADAAAGPRIAVVTGPAGAGKTALAVRWAHTRSADFPDGQLFVDLRGYAEGDCEDPAHVLERFLVALGVPGPQVPSGVAARADLYRSSLSNRRVLVILDNARDIGQVRPLLPGAPGCLTLVTSRDALGSLVVEAGAVPVRLARMTPEQSVEVLSGILGTERVAAEPEQATELARLCGELPLALRITAARLVEDPEAPLAELVAELSGEPTRLDGLELPGDQSSAVARALDHSYRQLQPEQARFFRLLGIQPGQLGAAAITALTSTGPVLPTAATAASRRLLRELEAVHLVERPRSDRYALHDLVRLYAQHRTGMDAAEREAATRRLFDWYICVSTEAERQLDPLRSSIEPQVDHQLDTPDLFPDTESAVAWFDLEAENLLATTRLAAAVGDHRAVWQLADHQFGHFMRSHRLDAFVESFELAEVAAQRAGNQEAAAMMANGLGVAHSFRRDVPSAKAAYERALALYQELGDRMRALTARANLGNLLFEVGLLAEARAYQEVAVAGARELEHPRILGIFLSNLALTIGDLGEYQASEALQEEALLVLDTHCPQERQYVFRGNLARVRAALGKYESAAAECRLALVEARGHGDTLHTARLLCQLGDCQKLSGQSDQARVSWQEALDAFTECGSSQAEVAVQRLADDDVPKGAYR